MVHMYCKGGVNMEAFGSGSRVALPVWWTVGSVKRLGLFPQVQGWAGGAEAARVSLTGLGWKGVPAQLHTGSKTDNLELSPNYLTW